MNAFIMIKMIRNNSNIIKIIHVKDRAISILHVEKIFKTRTPLFKETYNYVNLAIVTVELIP